jgi:hypothetical protein
MRIDAYSHREIDAGALGWGVSSDDVDHAIADLDPTMTAINAGIGACPQMAAADAQLWARAYIRWEAIKSDWAYDKQGSVAPGPVYGTGILARVQQSNNDATLYQGKLATACPALAPPVLNPLGGGGGANPTPPKPPDGGMSTLELLAILAAIAGGVYVVSKTGLPRVFGVFGGRRGRKA